ncbi:MULTISPECIES: hypothetical protein [Sphingobacterium]|uniref:hypothetical protein n=1 Tax=Sphingobacterium TaxID=28453 RepID=UPI00257ABBB8|nr:MULTISPECIES: hypothetical protein [Sphingobacterium]
MTLKEYADITMQEIKKVLTQQQLNNIYLGSTIKGIRDTYIDDEVMVTQVQYMKDIQKVMEKKEKYEICQRLQNMIIELGGRIEKNRKNKRVNNK